MQLSAKPRHSLIKTLFSLLEMHVLFCLLLISMEPSAVVRLVPWWMRDICAAMVWRWEQQQCALACEGLPHLPARLSLLQPCAEPNKCHRLLGSAGIYPPPLLSFSLFFFCEPAPAGSSRKCD